PSRCLVGPRDHRDASHPARFATSNPSSFHDLTLVAVQGEDHCAQPRGVERFPSLAILASGSRVPARAFCPGWFASGSRHDPDDKLDKARPHDMKLLGTNHLQARSSYQPTLHKYSGNQYILFTGHHTLGTNPVTGAPLPSFNPITMKNEENGTSIVDVTDPNNPVYLVHIPVPDGQGGGAQMVRGCDGIGL